VWYQPIVSILVPARNEEHVLGKLLERLTRLTYPKDKLEIIIIDDASSDKQGVLRMSFSKK
jgi:glycosyltransferase involved in cell wall biosynthesis